MCWQEPAPTRGCGCYLQALADTPLSGQRLTPETEAFRGLLGICSRNSHPTRAPSFILGGIVRQRRNIPCQELLACSLFPSIDRPGRTVKGQTGRTLWPREGRRILQHSRESWWYADQCHAARGLSLAPHPYPATVLPPMTIAVFPHQTSLFGDTFQSCSFWKRHPGE